MPEHHSHVEDTVQHLLDLHDLHEKRATPLQRFANRSTAALGRPEASAVILLIVVGWVVGNYAAKRLGFHGLEQFPFPDLAFVATVAALLVALLILTAQRHDQALANKQAQLTLQIAMLNERKITKLIGLLEQQREDNPLLPAREDPELEELVQPLDPILSLEQIETSRPRL